MKNEVGVVMTNRSSQSGATSAFSTQRCGTNWGNTTSELDFSQRFQDCRHSCLFFFFLKQNENWHLESSKGPYTEKNRKLSNPHIEGDALKHKENSLVIFLHSDQQQ